MGVSLISVVVPVLNGLPWLEDQLEALSRQDFDQPWELIIADNGSSDGSVGLVERWISDRRTAPLCTPLLTDASATKGPAAARNAGVRTSKGDVLAFCDADDVVSPGWLNSLDAALTDDQGLDLVAGTFDFGALNGGSPSAPVPAAMGQFAFLPAGLASNLAVRRSAFEAAGGFSEEMNVGEDIDFCWRVQLAGGRFGLATDAVVQRREPSSLGDLFRQTWSYGRSGPELFRRFRGSGAKRSIRSASKSWLWLLLNVPKIVRHDTRRAWVRAAGMRLGRISGCVTQKVFYP